MKKFIISLLLVGSFAFSQSNPDILAGFGVKGISIPDVTNYINSMTYQEEKSFSTAPEFYLASEFEITKDLGIKLDYNYIVKSYNKVLALGSILDITVQIHCPNVQLSYLIKGEGYYFKLGGGLGYYFGSFSQKLITNTESIYKSKGLGIKLNADGHTTLGGNFYALITANLQVGFLGEVKDMDNIPIPRTTNKVSLGFIGAGLGFGLSYYF